MRGDQSLVRGGCLGLFPLLLGGRLLIRRLRPLGHGSSLGLLDADIHVLDLACLPAVSRARFIDDKVVAVRSIAAHLVGPQHPLVTKRFVSICQQLAADTFLAPDVVRESLSSLVALAGRRKHVAPSLGHAERLGPVALGLLVGAEALLGGPAVEMLPLGLHLVQSEDGLLADATLIADVHLETAVVGGPDGVTASDGPFVKQGLIRALGEDLLLILLTVIGQYRIVWLGMLQVTVARRQASRSVTVTHLAQASIASTHVP